MLRKIKVLKRSLLFILLGVVGILVLFGIFFIVRYIIIILANRPPSVSLVSKPSKVYQGNNYEFVFHVVDPEAEEVSISVDWGDSYTNEFSFVPSDSYITQRHSWGKYGVYTIKVIAKDKKGAKTRWQNVDRIEVIGVKWKFENRIGPFLAIGNYRTIYVGSPDSYLYALNADGTTEWEFKTEGEIASVPLVDKDENIYVWVNTKSAGYLYAIKPNGTKKWKFKTEAINLEEEELIPSPIIGSDGTIYAVFGNNLYAINSDGSLKWKFEASNKIGFPPLIGSDGAVYLCFNKAEVSNFLVLRYIGTLYAINPDGVLKWKFETSNGIVSSPVIGNDGTIYIGASNSLYVMNSDGSLKWEFEASNEIDFPPVIGSDGTIYVGAGNSLYAINPDGSLKWKSEVSNEIVFPPVIGRDGTVYLCFNVDYYGFNNERNYLYAIDTNGKLKWKFEIGGGITFSTLPVIGRDGTIYIGTDKYTGSDYFAGFLYAINPDGTLEWELFTDGTVKFLAVSKDGTIYVIGYDNYYYLFAINTED